MQNVNIRVVSRDEEDDEPQPAPTAAFAAPARSSFSPSMMLTRVIGVIFPLIAIVIFVFSMGNMACSQGNAPAAVCSALTSITGR